MASVVAIEDYYFVLKVEFTASTETISKSYKRLALRLHPDRNRQSDANQAFQLLSEAYQTLKDGEKRRSYNAIYWSVRITELESAAPQTTQHEHTASDAADKTRIHKAALRDLQRSKAERTKIWSRTKKVYDDAISELNRDIQKIQGTLSSLEDVENAIRQKEADDKSWTTLIISVLYTRHVDTEEEKERKEQERIERIHTKDLNQRKLQANQSGLRDYEDLQRDKLEDFEFSNSRNEVLMSAFQESIRIQQIRQHKEERLREAKERTWREWKVQQAELKQEQYKHETRVREAEIIRDKEREDERRRQQMSEQLARENEVKQRFQEAVEREALRVQKAVELESRRRAILDQLMRVGNCSHDGWWDSVTVHSTCDVCSTSEFGYMLQCPSCHKTTCVDCQSFLRPPLKRRKGRKKSRAHIHSTHSPF